MSHDREEFMNSLKLPQGVTYTPYKGMTRCHFTYYGTGITSLDMQKKYYHLRAKEEHLRAIHVTDYEIDNNHHSVPGTIKQIPYDNAEVFYKLVDYIIQQEGGDINVARLPLRKENDGTITYYTCPRCEVKFKRSFRCPECGQLIQEYD